MDLEFFRSLHFQQQKKKHETEKQKWARGSFEPETAGSEIVRLPAKPRGPGRFQEVKEPIHFSLDIVGACGAPGQGPNYEENTPFWPTPLLSEDVWDKHIISLGLVNIGNNISLAMLTEAAGRGQ